MGLTYNLILNASISSGWSSWSYDSVSYQVFPFHPLLLSHSVYGCVSDSHRLFHWLLRLLFGGGTGSTCFMCRLLLPVLRWRSSSLSQNILKGNMDIKPLNKREKQQNDSTIGCYCIIVKDVRCSLDYKACVLGSEVVLNETSFSG